MVYGLPGFLGHLMSFWRLLVKRLWMGGSWSHSLEPRLTNRLMTVMPGIGKAVTSGFDGRLGTKGMSHPVCQIRDR